MTWFYKFQPFTEDQIGDNIGFVYLIINLVNNKQYIGKKLFSFAKTQKPLKGKVNKRRSRVSSDWREYYGSNKELLADIEKLGKDKFQRSILRLCLTKGTVNYIEAKYILENDAIIKDDWYNGWLDIRINKSQIKL